MFHTLKIAMLFVLAMLFAGCGESEVDYDLSSFTSFNNEEACTQITGTAAQVIWDRYKNMRGPITPEALRQITGLSQDLDIVMVNSTATDTLSGQHDVLLIYSDELGVAFAAMYFDDKSRSTVISENFRQSVRIHTQNARYNLDLFAQKIANGEDLSETAVYHAMELGSVSPNNKEEAFLTDFSLRQIMAYYHLALSAGAPEKVSKYARSIGLMTVGVWHEAKLGHKK